jgi:hypothetical protein
MGPIFRTFFRGKFLDKISAGKNVRKIGPSEKKHVLIGVRNPTASHFASFEVGHDCILQWQ